MSGYLDVKCPARASRGLGLFKAWKKQWCILRPNPTVENSGVIALHSSFGLSANSTIELPPGTSVCRTQSRTHHYAFGIFMPGVYRKPQILLAGQTESETQQWIAKIRNILNGKNYFGKDILLKNSYEVSIIDNEFSRKCLLYGVHGTLSISSHGLLISQNNHGHNKIFIAWKHFSNIVLASPDNAPDKNKTCLLSTNSSFSGGAGRLSMYSMNAPELVRAVRAGRADAESSLPSEADRRISRSEGDLYNRTNNSSDTDSVLTRRSSWYSGPSEVSLDDTDLIMTKRQLRKMLPHHQEAIVVPSGQLLRSAAADDLFPITHSKQHLLSYVHKFSHAYADTPPDRRSCASVASGIYEEILEDNDLPNPDNQRESNEDYSDTKSTPDPTGVDLSMDLEENMYESVAECVYGTMPRTGKRYPPPPLPPRCLRSPHTLISSTVYKETWRCSEVGGTDTVDGAVPLHASLGSLPRCGGPSATAAPHRYPRAADTLPKFNKNKPSAFNVFRKRIKSDSRVLLKPIKSDEAAPEDKTPVEPKKKRFDFAATPSKSIDIIKKFRVSRVLMRNLRISSRNLAKLGEARSCECLESESVAERVDKRCSKSAEGLDGELAADLDASLPLHDDADDGRDLSALYSDGAEHLSLPHDIVELILRGRDDLAEVRLRRRQASECEYMPMSPVGVAAAVAAPRAPPPPCEEHYIVMTSPACAPPADIAT